MGEMRWKVAAGLLLGGLVAVGSCRDHVSPDAPDGPTPPGIVSNPVTPTAPTRIASLATNFATVLGPGVAYVSFRPGTFPGGVAATISNPSGLGAQTVPLVAGGLDPVAIPAAAGDSLTFSIDTGGALPLRFVRVVPVAVSATVVRTEPSGGRRDVPLNIRVRVVFSEPVDPTSVTSSTLRLLRDGVPQSGETALSADGLDATFVPADSLQPTTDYTLELGTGIRDSDGAPLEDPVTVRFTTGAASSTAAVALRFNGSGIREPVTSIAGMVIPPTLEVYAQDTAGNWLEGFAGSITITIGSNASGADLGGTTTRVGSRVEFDDLTIDRSGRGYTLIATSPGAISDTTAAFDIVESVPTTDAIAFTDTYLGIMVARSDGASEAVALVGRALVGEVGDPAWAPDGKRLAFTKNWCCGTEDGEIYRINTDGTGMLPIREGNSPAWSPDGNTIAFTSLRDGNREIYVMRPDGSEVVRLTNDPGSAYDPTWSPDGTKLAFTRNVGDTAEIFVMHADGTEMSSLHVSGSQPAWSPDGSRIAFTRPIPGAFASDIYVMGADGTQVTRLTHNPTLALSMEPNWSPDGRIVFSHTADVNSDGTQLYIMRADGSGVTRLAAEALKQQGNAREAAWSPR